MSRARRGESVLNERSGGREKLDPWSVAAIEDYERLLKEFGISPFAEIRSKIENPHLYMRRGIIFGHRGYEEVLEAMRNGDDFAVISGFMPSGKVHIGNKMVMDEIIWHQKRGAYAFSCIADIESHSVRGISWEKCKRLGVGEYILSLIALGFDINRGFLYFQSENKRVQDLAVEAGTEVNFSEMSAIYGFRSDVKISHMFSVLVQIADILQPQHKDFGGPKPTVVPVGADQDPHIRLTRDVASRLRMFTVERRRFDGENYVSIRLKKADRSALNDVLARLDSAKKTRLYEMHLDVWFDDDENFEEKVKEVERIVREVEVNRGGYGFFLPASTYHKFMRGLTGGKMSSSNPQSVISLTEPPEEAARKVKNALTGGRATAEEQRRLGGEPEKCAVYELLLTHLIEDDAFVREIYEECKTGRRICRSCKELAAELMRKFLKMHQEERENAKELLKEYDFGRRWLSYL